MRSKMWAAALLCAVAMMAAGCDGNDAKSSGSEAPKAASYADAQAVADAAGLKGCETTATGHDFVDEVSCGERAIVLRFDEADELDQWLQSYLVNGREGDAAVLHGERWAVACPERATCSAIKGAVGGTLKP